MHVMMCISLVGMASPVSEINFVFCSSKPQSHTHKLVCICTQKVLGTSGHSTNYVLHISSMTMKLSTGWLCRYTYRISGFFRGVQFSRFRKNYTQKTKILYGSHLIFDRFAKI